MVGEDIDVLKYGFKLEAIEDDFIEVYTIEINKFEYLELTILGDIYSLRVIDRDASSRNLDVFNRYTVETQEQLDYLILKGRVGWFILHPYNNFI
jgi:hypothetical protein